MGRASVASEVIQGKLYMMDPGNIRRLRFASRIFFCVLLTEGHQDRQKMAGRGGALSPKPCAAVMKAHMTAEKKGADDLSTLRNSTSTHLPCQRQAQCRTS